MGPSLDALRSNWTNEELGKFLKAPNDYKKQDKRLQELASRYRIPMPAFSMDEESREKLITYLLEQSR